MDQSLSVKCLASGSSGNAYLLRGEKTSILIDCGLPAKDIVSHLKRQRVDPGSIAAILVTHEHTDHIQSVGTMSRRYGIPVVANQLTLEAASAQVGEVIQQVLPTGSCISVGGFDVASFPTSHDGVDSVGYLATLGGASVCVLTDTGTTLPQHQEVFSLADLIILEANHDPDLLTAGPYPQNLKDRIRGNKGHLSNLQAAQLIAEAHSSRPQTVWLAHLSAVNNTPGHAKNTVAGFLARERIQGVQVALTQRDKPSLSWSPGSTGWQMTLI